MGGAGDIIGHLCVGLTRVNHKSLLEYLTSSFVRRWLTYWMRLIVINGMRFAA
jgi:hypothetical protein